MAFSGSSGLNLKKFESQDEVDEKKKKRQEEWEKVRKPEDPEEFPEEPVDNRCLYDRLEEQRQKQQDEFEEKVAFRNQVKRLDDDEAEFLDFVTETKQEITKARNQEETDIISELKSAQVVKIEDKKPAEEKKSKSATQQQQSSSKKSQMALLAGAVKRKGSADGSPPKKARVETEASQSGKSDEARSQGDQRSDSNPCDAPSNRLVRSSVPVARVIGIRPVALAGLTQYEDSSDSMSSSSDSDIELPAAGRTGVTLVVKQNVQQQH